MINRALIAFGCGLAFAGAAIAGTTAPLKTANAPVVTEKRVPVPRKPAAAISLVPILIEDCQREPKTSYWQKMKSEFKKLI